jgi:hypothetical protein
MIDSRTRAARLRRPTALALCLIALATIADVAPAQVSSGPGPTPIPGPMPIPGPGGQYRGPADTVPPNLPPFDPNNPATCPPSTQPPCNPALLPKTGCGTACPALPMVEQGNSECIHCQGDPPGSGQCYLATGWSLTFGTARAYCHAMSCLDANRNVTICATQPNSCELHVIESDWINHDLFTNRPVCAPVAAQACLDGGALFSNPHAIDQLDKGTASCGTHTVCLTFNADCFCNAVLSWETWLGTGASYYDSHFLFHIGFTSCNTCDCSGGTPP